MMQRGRNRNLGENDNVPAHINVDSQVINVIQEKKYQLQAELQLEMKTSM